MKCWSVINFYFKLTKSLFLLYTNKKKSNLIDMDDNFKSLPIEVTF
jgi:hypothetical protein